ncbi:MAG: nucleotidyltransferase family protein [Ilumatobacteraceae bacterium]
MLVVAVLLAAGAGTRFSGPTHKLLASLDGHPVAGHALDHVIASEVGPVVVVTGAVDLGLLLAQALDRVGRPVVHVRNEHWADGQATSMALALDAADEMGADHVVVGLADQPFIPAEAWRAVALAPPEWPAVVASYDGRRGPHPVRLHRSLWPLLPRSGDDGARRLLRDHPDLVHDVACPGSAADIDTWEDVQRWKSS